MSRLANVQVSNGNKPIRIGVYGIEGCGKSTFGSKAPAPVFISPEGGTDRIPGAKNLPCATWKDLIETLTELLKDPHQYKTIVLDTADWIEKLAHKEILGNTNKSITTVNGGYGAGFRESEAMHRDLIDLLTLIRDKRGMNIIVTAHYQVKDVKDPDAAHDYQQHEMKCHDYVSSIWREWVDALIFVRFETFTKEGSTKNARAFGTDVRIAFTEKRPSFQAKNRFGLPPEMPFTLNFWNDFMKAAGNVDPDSLEQLGKDLNELLPKLDESVRAKVEERIKKANNDRLELTRIREGVKTMVKS